MLVHEIENKIKEIKQKILNIEIEKTEDEMKAFHDELNNIIKIHEKEIRELKKSLKTAPKQLSFVSEVG